MDIQALTTDRRAEMFDLLRLCLGERKTVRRDERFWGWKHEQNPFGPSLVLLGEEEGQLVGLRALLRWRLEAGAPLRTFGLRTLGEGNQSQGSGAGDGHLAQAAWGEIPALEGGSHTLAVLRAVDTVTHPAWRQRGIFTRLTQAGLEAARAAGVALVFNTPNRNSLPGYLKMGWRRVGRLPVQVQVPRPLRFATGLARAKLLGRPLAPAGSVEPWLSPPLPAAVFLDQATGLEALVARDATLRGPGWRTVRSPDFLRWRYAAHPYVTYYVEAVWEQGHGGPMARAGISVRGVLFWRLQMRFGLWELTLCDLLLAEPDLMLVAELVAGARRRLAADYLIACFSPASVQGQLLRRLGFWNPPGQGINFTVRLLGAGDGVGLTAGRDGAGLAPDPLELANWSLCLGDVEIF